MKTFKTETLRKPSPALLLALLGAITLAASGCKHAPPPPPPRIQTVRVSVTAAPDVNPDPSGRPSPVVIRIYRLRGADEFNGAGMDRLYTKDREVLAANLVARDEFPLHPGDSRDTQLDLAADVQGIGVMAEIRDYHSVPWRVYMAVPAPPKKKGPHVLVLNVQVSRSGVVLADSSGLKDK
jgi:type VI secretion system protein VasD